MNKYILVGGVAIAGAGIWYIKKTEKPEAVAEPTKAPVTYYTSQESAGSRGAAMGSIASTGGGVPSSQAPGVTTVPPKEPEKKYALPPRLPQPVRNPVF